MPGHLIIKFFVLNNSTIIKTLRNFPTQCVSQIFEMHVLYIIWLYAYQFITCKVSVEAFSLLYANLFHAKLCLSIIGVTLAASNWQFISIYSCFICN